MKKLIFIVILLAHWMPLFAPGVYGAIPPIRKPQKIRIIDSYNRCHKFDVSDLSGPMVHVGDTVEMGYIDEQGHHCYVTGKITHILYE